MSEAEDFSSAAFRHWRDAELLDKENRVENADQLYGFAAECAIKKALIELPAFSNNGELNQYYKEHINNLWEKVKLQSLQKRYPALLTILKDTNHFSDWRVEQRYCKDGVASVETMKKHQKMAKRLLGAVGLPGERK